MLFEAGATVVRRDVLHGRLWSAAPYRVMADDGEVLQLACWPGVRSLAPTTWTHWLTTGDDVVRKQGIPNMARGTWDLAPWVWRDTTVLLWAGIDPDFAVHLFRPVSGGPPRWYVNFERPVRRNPIGYDTFDLLLDLVVDADEGRWSWKDEDEYEQGRRLGLITDEDHRRLGQARERAVAMVESRGGPFAQGWLTWTVPADWELPELPPRTLELG